MKNTLEGVNSRPRIQKNTSDPGDRMREIMQSEQEKEGGSGSEESTRSARDSGLIPGSGRSLGEEVATRSSTLAWRIPWKRNPVGYVHGVAKSQTRLSD